MGGNTLGHLLQVTTWGESHGESMGCIVDGFPAGMRLDLASMKEDLKRDVPYPVLTRRVEENRMRLLSGVYRGRTLGTPISIIVRNSNVESDRYYYLHLAYLTALSPDTLYHYLDTAIQTR